MDQIESRLKTSGRVVTEPARSDAAVLDYRKAMTTCLEGRGYAVR